MAAAAAGAATYGSYAAYAGYAVAAAASAASAYTTVKSYTAQKKAGAQAAYEADMEAKSEEVAAIQRESDRKYRLASALASQNASAGSKGVVAFEGSPLAILKEDVEMEKVATERDDYSTDMSAMMTRARGSSVQRGASINAISGLVRDTTKLAQRF